MEGTHHLLAVLGVGMLVAAGWVAAYGTWRAKHLAGHQIPEVPSASVMAGITILACGAAAAGLASVLIA